MPVDARSGLSIMAETVFSPRLVWGRVEVSKKTYPPARFLELLSDLKAKSR